MRVRVRVRVKVRLSESERVRGRGGAGGRDGGVGQMKLDGVREVVAGRLFAMDLSHARFALTPVTRGPG